MVDVVPIWPGRGCSMPVKCSSITFGRKIMSCTTVDAVVLGRSLPGVRHGEAGSIYASSDADRTISFISCVIVIDR